MHQRPLLKVFLWSVAGFFGTVAQYAWYAWYAISGPCAERWLFSCGLMQKPLRMLQNLKMLIMSRMLCGGITYVRHEAWDETCQEGPAVEIWCPRKCWMITFDDSHRPPTKGPWSMTISNDYRFCMTISSEQMPPAISQSWRPRTFTLPSFWYAWFRISSTDRFRGCASDYVLSVLVSIISDINSS